MDKNAIQWTDYYQKIVGRKPREMLIQALGRFGADSSITSSQAIDLGCGDGTETVHLLANSWRVLAIDAEPAAFTYLKEKLSLEVQERLQTQIAKFEDVELSPADLIYAGYSLPFCHPQHFGTLWTKIVNNINPGGRFAGQLFGVNDTWASSTDMTFQTADQAQALFTGFELEHFHEEDENGHSTNGPKHWHLFDVIARKK